VRGAIGSLLLLVLVAGCGGGNSRNDFVNDALEICRKANDRVQALGTPESFTATQLYGRQAKDAVGDEIDELRKLTSPAELDEPFAQYLATLEQRHRQLELLVEAADKNDGEEIQDVGTELDLLTAKARTQARRAAIAACESG
jgi:hypothetical protein